MSVRTEIALLEEEMRRAELGPDPEFFQRHIDDEMVFVGDGQASKPKSHIVDAHRPGLGQKFTEVTMSDMTILDHGNTAVVTCTGTYTGLKGTHVLKFLRVWARKSDGWKIVAGSMI